MKLVSTVFALCLVSLIAQGGQKMATSFGDPMKLKSPISMSQAVKDYKKYVDKDILVKAKVVKVCEKSGCWMSLQDGDAKVRTMFKDYGFFVPKEINGKNVMVEGRIALKEISAAAARHFLKDEGASMKEQTQIRKPQQKFQFEATGVKVI